MQSPFETLEAKRETSSWQFWAPECWLSCTCLISLQTCYGMVMFIVTKYMTIYLCKSKFIQFCTAASLWTLSRSLSLLKLMSEMCQVRLKYTLLLMKSLQNPKSVTFKSRRTSLILYPCIYAVSLVGILVLGGLWSFINSKINASQDCQSLRKNIIASYHQRKPLIPTLKLKSLQGIYFIR